MTSVLEIFGLADSRIDVFSELFEQDWLTIKVKLNFFYLITHENATSARIGNRYKALTKLGHDPVSVSVFQKIGYVHKLGCFYFFTPKIHR